MVYELEGLKLSTDADRLPNGHTLVAQDGEVAEYDAKGEKIWSKKMTKGHRSEPLLTSGLSLKARRGGWRASSRY